MILLGKLEKLPMPPSINACYATVGRRRISSQALRTFKSKSTFWAILNRPDLVDLRDEVPVQPGRICLKFIFRFPARRLYLKKGEVPKKLDVSNRIKPAEDMVCELLGFDDRHVFRVEAEKVEGEVEDFDCAVFRL